MVVPYQVHHVVARSLRAEGVTEVGRRRLRILEQAVGPVLPFRPFVPLGSFAVSHEQARHKLDMDDLATVVVQEVAEVWGAEHSVLELEAQLRVELGIKVLHIYYLEVPHDLRDYLDDYLEEIRK